MRLNACFGTGPRSSVGASTTGQDLIKAGSNYLCCASLLRILDQHLFVNDFYYLGRHLVPSSSGGDDNFVPFANLIQHSGAVMEDIAVCRVDLPSSFHAHPFALMKTTLTCCDPSGHEGENTAQRPDVICLVYILYRPSSCLPIAATLRWPCTVLEEN